MQFSRGEAPLCEAEYGREAPAVLLVQLRSDFLLRRLGLGLGRCGDLAHSVVERGFGILVVNDESHDRAMADLHSHLTPDEDADAGLIEACLKQRLDDPRRL